MSRRSKLYTSPEQKARYWAKKKGPLGVLSKATNLTTRFNKLVGWNRKKGATRL